MTWVNRRRQHAAVDVDTARSKKPQRLDKNANTSGSFARLYTLLACNFRTSSATNHPRARARAGLPQNARTYTARSPHRIKRRSNGNHSSTSNANSVTIRCGNLKSRYLHEFVTSRVRALSSRAQAGPL